MEFRILGPLGWFQRASDRAALGRWVAESVGNDLQVTVSRLRKLLEKDHIRGTPIRSSSAKGILTYIGKQLQKRTTRVERL